MIIERKPDWQNLLSQYIARVSRLTYKPGIFDCAIFAAGAIEAMTGTDLRAEFGNYKTLKSGLSQLKKKGYSDHVNFVEKHFVEIEPAFLHPGDIAIVNGAVDNALSIVQGAAIYVLNEGMGIGLIPFREAKRGFRVPYAEQI